MFRWTMDISIAEVPGSISIPMIHFLISFYRNGAVTRISVVIKERIVDSLVLN